MEKTLEKTLKVYKIGYSNDEAFPTKDTQLLINAFTYNAKRMGDTPTISCTVKCDFIPENEWTEEVYVKFNNERFYLKRTPSSVLDNTDARYKYTLDFVSERNILNNVYFFNVVYGEKEGYRGASNDVNFRFTGDIHEFVGRLNYSLQYSKLQTITNGVVEGYHVVVDSDVTTEYKDVEFDAQFFSNALQEVFNTYDLPYYFVGKTIHVGHHDDNSAIEEPFEYGSEHGLISVTKTSENNKIVNRISGHGSAENIPYYYPNDTPKGVLEFVTPSTNKHLQASNFVIANGERVSSTTDLISEVDAGVSAEVEFIKHTANSIHSSYSDDGKNLLKIESYAGANNAWVETTLGYGDVQDDNKCLKNTSASGTWGVEYTLNYHVRVKFIATNQDGGVLKWEWKTNPFYKTIDKQIESDGDIAYAFFKDLKAYEIINNEQVEIKPHQSETYPTSIISTAFNGSKNSDGSSTVEIHLEFTFWKARISEDHVLMIGDLQYTNFTKITLETGIKDYYRWKNARNSYVSLKDMGVSLTPDSVASDFEANKDKYVGEKFSLKQTEYILPTQNLMPTIYRDSKGDERFYKALNGKYVVPDRFKEELTDDVAPDGIYPFAHPYIEGKPREHMQDFEDIKPTIKEMLNGEGKRMDMFLDFAYDKNDNDEVDENGKYLHPYFFAKLPKYDGGNGFNLFDHAIESGAMQIAMTDGWCAGCKFNIAVDPDTQKNVVQVDDKGYLVRDGYGNVVVKKGSAQDKQNDTRTNTVWIALEKDTESYGVVMPNKGTKNQPTPNKDTFVILNIALPKAYITAAEKRLEEELIHYMYNNNNQLFNFSIKFSRIYLEEHPEVLKKLNENSAITVVYKGIPYPLHVSSYTYKMDGNSILPEITVDLSDKLTIATNAIENAVQQAKAEFRTTVASIDYLSNSRNFFIRKDEDDTAIGHLDFEKGFTSNGNADFGKFVAGTQGASIYKDDAGNWYIESDYLRVRKKFSAKSVEIEEAHHVGGSQLLTAANCVVDFVKPITDSEGNTIAYRCFFLKEDSNGKGVTNKWKTGDQAYCKSFNLAGTNDGSNSDPDKYYWRKVVATSQDTSEEEMTLTSGDTTIITSNYHFIDLSNKDDEKDVQSDIPYTNDNIVQLGYQGTDDESRQNAIVLAGAGEGSPYIRQYMGINSFELPEPDTQIKPGDNVLSGTTKFKTYKDKDKQLNDLDKEIESTSNAINNLETGTNILRNSGFNGDYDVIDLDGDGVLNADETDLFSPSLEYWDAEHVTAEKSDESASGKCVVSQRRGTIKQILDVPLEKGANYIFSFKGKGTQVTVKLSEDVKEDITLNSTIGYYEYKFEAKDNHKYISISMGATTTLFELSLIRGTISNKTWAANSLDNRKERAEYESLSYVQNLLKANTVIDGGKVSTGVVNTGLINMGNYDNEGNFVEVTAGMSGTYNNEHSVAFFGGGDLAKAIYTVAKYRDNPNYEPTTEELASMAKAVITHGGRAILQDIILRGYVYAEGGVFRGKVYAEDGEFRGIIKAKDSIFEGTVHATDGEFNGTVYATDGEFNGKVSAKLTYTPTVLINVGEEGYIVDVENNPIGWFNIEPINATDDFTPQITLPRAEDYPGLELSFFASAMFNTTGASLVKINHTIVAQEGDSIQVKYNVKSVTIGGETIDVVCNNSGFRTVTQLKLPVHQPCRIKAFENKWIVLEGFFKNE